jgi:hypothetical protein
MPIHTIGDDFMVAADSGRRRMVADGKNSSRQQRTVADGSGRRKQRRTAADGGGQRRKE